MEFSKIMSDLKFFFFGRFTDHFIGLRDENTEGVWRWLDGTQIPGNWNWWAVAEPTTGFLKSSAILRAHVTPEVRTAMHLGSSASSDNADFIVCEYVGGKCPAFGNRKF